ncbi:alpha/beta hydrolase [Phaeobacter sp. PT47_59]|uniref:alpha/beta fold hydrolase n=1 Tax=Phaeobacter sp. PT47_59 TaxID=3029979 RepID=UPI002380983E|nr:alpha/beta hydrolase [Phaeobacter sp. PT47_59]MDE4176703.1 alpha/beta hydrolase [Phaeobacter sp. PT47_59]
MANKPVGDVTAVRPDGTPCRAPIVFIPGFMLDRDLWTDVERSLSGIAPTLHPDLRLATSIDDMAQQALKFSPERFTLVGFSMGGYVAREMARLAPDRVERLVLIATSCRADTPDRGRAKAAAAVEPQRFGGIARSAIRQSLSPRNANDAQLVERIRQMSLRLGPDTWQRQLAFRRDGDCAKLSEITCPTLIITGRDDRLRSNAEAEELRDGITGARLVRVPTGHMVPLENPRILARIIRAFIFVSTVAGQASHNLKRLERPGSTRGRRKGT